MFFKGREVYQLAVEVIRGNTVADFLCGLRRAVPDQFSDGFELGLYLLWKRGYIVVDVAEASHYFGGALMLTIQSTPYLSVTMPKVSPQNCLDSGIVALPPWTKES